MGWNSYYTCNCDPSEELMIEETDKFLELGFKEAGYEYINLDDGWLKPERDENGRLQYRDDIFPHGMNYLTDYIHSKGLKAGTYLGCGITSWHGDAGGLGHEYEDAEQIAQWGFDLIKYDRHPTDDDPPRDTVTENIKMGLAIKAASRDMVYSLCEHGTSAPWNWAAPVAGMWRTGRDVSDNWSLEYSNWGHGILDLMDWGVADISQMGHAGAFNDPDMLMIGLRRQTDWCGGGSTTEEYKAYFAIWAMLASPLLIGADLRKIRPEDVETLKNPGVIAINQDPLCIPAKRIHTDKYGHDLWVRPLSDFRWAVLIVSRSNNTLNFGFSLEDFGLSRNVPMKLTDAWTGEEIARIDGGVYSTYIESHGHLLGILTPDIK